MKEASFLSRTVGSFNGDVLYRPFNPWLLPLFDLAAFFVRIRYNSYTEAYKFRQECLYYGMH